MATYLVRTPVAGYNGDVGNIHFKDGQALVDEEAQEINYLRGAGYIFTDPAAGEPAADEPVDETPVEADVDGDGVVDELPKKTAVVAEWRAFAVAHGMPQADADAMSKDALINHYTPKEG